MVAAPSLKAAEIRLSDRLPTVVPVLIVAERDLDQPPDRVFGAYVDIDQRARWYPLPDEIVRFESHDFRAGGTDRFRHGPDGTPRLIGSTDYKHIVDNHCIAFVEQLTAATGQLLSISLVTWTMNPTETGTLLSITDQTTSVVGSGPIESCRYNYELMLDRLSLHLAASNPPHLK